MLLAWRATGSRGITGLIHPSTHLTGTKDAQLRKSAYHHLRLHADFVNELYLFAKPVDHSTHFSMNIYGPEREIDFQHASWLMHPTTLTRSLQHDDSGPVPGIKKYDEQAGKYVWDLQPHRRRIVTVTSSTLADWRDLAAEEEPVPEDEARLLFPVTADEESAITAIAKWPYRVGSKDPLISIGFHEKNDRAAGHFEWKPGKVADWNDVILQGPFFGVANPFAKQPIEGALTSSDLERWDHTTLPEDAVPRTSYRRQRSMIDFKSAHTTWLDREEFAAMALDTDKLATVRESILDKNLNLPEQELEQAIQEQLRRESEHPYSDFFRVAWRVMNRPKNERVLQACLIPPGPAHVDAVRSMALDTAEETALMCGFFSGLPSEYLLRITNRTHMDVSHAKVFPAPTSGTRSPPPSCCGSSDSTP